MPLLGNPRDNLALVLCLMQPWHLFNVQSQPAGEMGHNKANEMR